MEPVGVRELRQNLSKYLAQVKEGESFAVTERGREVAACTGSFGVVAVTAACFGEEEHPAPATSASAAIPSRRKSAPAIRFA